MLQRKRILVVDDEPAIRLRAQALLGKEYNLAFAGDGLDALEKVTEFRPDVILLDIDMPRLNGLETCRRIREDEEHRFTKIIFVSGNLSLEDRLAGYRAGADDYIVKPYDAEELMAKIRIMLRLEHQERLSSMKSHFLTLISHETRTPLNGILGFAQILDAKVPADCRRITAMLRESGLRLWEFIEKASMLCEIKSDITLQLSEEPVGALLATIIDNRADKIAAKDIFITLPNDNSDTVTADRTLLGKALGFIIDNAIKFSKVGGRVVIGLASAADGDCVITVADQGDGVPPERQREIFDEFAIHDIAHHHRGQGLSLAIARQVVRLHCGSITVGNGSDGGAVFTIRLPQGRKQAPAQPSDGDEQGGIPQRGRDGGGTDGGA